MSVVQERGLVDRLYARITTRRARALFEEFRNAVGPPRRLTAGIIVAVVLAAFVHLITLGLVCATGWLVLQWPAPWAVVGAVIAGILAIIFRPRRVPVPLDGVSRERAPELYRFLDRLACAVGSARVDVVTVSGDLNAFVYRAGWFGRVRVLDLGLPLWLALTPRERVGVLGHELGHFAHGDLRFGSFVGGALASLEQWYELVHPGSLWDDELEGLIPLALVPVNMARIALAVAIATVTAVLAHLIYGNSQRAEYMADRAASRLSGSDAFASSLQKVLLAHEHASAVQGAALAGGREGAVQAFVDAVRRVPAEELARRVEQTREDMSAMDATHPPLALRIEAACERAEPGTFALADHDLEAIDAELAPLQAIIDRAIVDRYRDSLYAG